MSNDEPFGHNNRAKPTVKKIKKSKKNRLTSAAPATRPTGNIRTDAENMFPKAKGASKANQKKQSQIQQ